MFFSGGCFFLCLPSFLHLPSGQEGLQGRSPSQRVPTPRLLPHGLMEFFHGTGPGGWGKVLGAGRNSLVCSTGHAQGSAASSPARVGGHGSCSLSTSAEVPPLKYSSRHPCSRGHLPHEMLVLQDQKKNKILKLLHNPSNECNQGHAATNGSLPTSQCIEVRLYSSSSMETLIFTQWHSEQLLLTYILQHSRKKNAIVGLGLLFLLQCW